MSSQFLRNIFSIRNSFCKRHKIVTILGIKIKIRVKGAIENYFKIYNEKVGLLDAEIIHIMANNLYTTTFYNMVKKYDDIKRHQFVFYRGNLTNYLINNKAENVKFGNIETIKINLNKNKKIIIHGILEKEIFNWLYSNQEYLKRVYWCIWSSDLYKFKGKKYDYVRKNVKAIITIYDKEKYIANYGTKKSFNAYYLNPLFDKFTEKNKKDYIQILVNQCVKLCTIDALNILKKYKNEKIKIITPLSYYSVGENNEHIRNQIIETGKKLFGEKYIPLTKFLPPHEYAKLLSNTDIMVVNLENNGAAGNLAGVIYAGGKVYLKNSSTTKKAFQNGNITTFSYEDIEKMNYQEFISYDENIKHNNQSNIKKYFSEEYVASLWKKVFDDEVNNG